MAAPKRCAAELSRSRPRRMVRYRVRADEDAIRPGGAFRSTFDDPGWCRKMMFRIGIISDTHGLLRPEAERRLAGVDHIVHAGDIGRPEIVDALRRIAPVTAIRGNVDSGAWAREYPDTILLRLAGKSIYVLHDLKTLQADPGAGIDVIVSGHSHVPKIETVGSVLYLNPGSAGRRRFNLPITLATLAVTPEGLRPEIHNLGGR